MQKNVKQRRQKTSKYRVIEDAVSSGDHLPLKTTLILLALLTFARLRAWLGFAPGTAAYMWVEHILLVIQFRREWWIKETIWAAPLILGDRKEAGRMKLNLE